ncbi:MAG: GNAT family N-acetyltransferase [Bradyrhizobium sp.]
MDIVELSLKMKRLTQWLDSQRPPAGLIRKCFDGPPFGHCYVTIDPNRQARFASGNMNRAYLCGAEPGMDADSIRRLIELFAAEGIERFFVWLSPGPDMEMVRGRLAASGLTRVRWTGYPTMWRGSGSPVRFSTGLDVREVGVDEIAAMRDPPDEMIWPDYVRTAGQEGCFHYMAFDGQQPVAIATLCTFEGIGYLTSAATAESHRRRGAQQALIARRLERAEALGCTIAVSETLYMLEHSYRNLQRAGFEVAYDKEVYEWSR